MPKTSNPIPPTAPRSGTAPAADTDDLARLLPLWPHELSDPSKAGIEKRMALLQRALRAERQRGRQGHWAYDLARHAALLRVYQRQSAKLQEHKRDPLNKAGTTAT
jgi:hypothetical protein